VDGRHAASLVVSGIFKGVLCNASAGVLGDQFYALNDAVDDLKQEEKSIRAAGSEPRPQTRSNRGTLEL